jgi:hypothetical protein
MENFSSTQQSRRLDMTVSIIAARGPLSSRAKRRILQGSALVAVAASLFAIPVSTFGADPATASSRAIAEPSQPVRAGHLPIASQPSASPNAKVDRLAGHAPTIDRLYEELMRLTGPACLSNSTNASMAGGC